jgi:hypothetical protein
MVAGAKPVSQLPLALRELLAEIRDADFRDRFDKILDAAARVIKNLRNFELIRYEGKSAEGGADLALLEEIAPVLMATVTEINRLVQAVETDFPPGWKSDSKEPHEAERAARVIEILRERTHGFRSDVLQLGAQLRTPQAVADRWNLLGHLQSARGKLRFGIGEMVTDVANVFAEVPRAKVVPEYELDVEHAILLRRTLAKLTVGLRSHNERLKTARASEFPPLVAKLNDLLDRLTKTQTWFELRAPDKREFIRFHEQLTSLASRGSPTGETRTAVEGFVRFLELLGTIVSQRDLLRSHDRACLAELTTLLEKAEGQLVFSADDARATVQEALTACEALAGRDEELDHYMGQLRNATTLIPADCIKALREHALRLLSSGN